MGELGKVEGWSIGSEDCSVVEEGSSGADEFIIGGCTSGVDEFIVGGCTSGVDEFISSATS